MTRFYLLHPVGPLANVVDINKFRALSLVGSFKRSRNHHKHTPTLSPRVSLGLTVIFICNETKRAALLGSTHGVSF